MSSLIHSTDKELVRAFQNGDNAALECLIKRYKDQIYTSIVIVVKDSYVADDIFQETFFKIINRLNTGKYSEEGKFSSWALRIARNLCLDYFRSPNQIYMVPSENSFFSDEVGDVINDSDKGISQAQSFERMKMLLNYIPVEQKETIVLRHFAGLSFKEIAALTNTTTNTTLGRMSYGLINLRKLIRKHQITL